MASSATASRQLNEIGCGWSLNTFNFAPRSSNFLGSVRFVIPAAAQSGQVYTLSFTNAGGAPDLTVEYVFETRRAQVAVGVSAARCGSAANEWKLHFFGSLTNANAADGQDPDGDGVPNWVEYLAGTDRRMRIPGLRSARPRIRWSTASPNWRSSG